MNILFKKKWICKGYLKIAGLIACAKSDNHSPTAGRDRQSRPALRTARCADLVFHYF